MHFYDQSKKRRKSCNTNKERSININQEEVTVLHAIKAFDLSRKRKIIYKFLMVFLLMLGFIGGLKTTSNQVLASADDPSDMLDVAKHFGTIGGDYVADTSKYGKYIDAPWKAWNYLGPGSGSVLTAATKGSKTSTYSALSSVADNNNSFSQAAQFQQALINTGLDHSVIGNPSGMLGFGRGCVAIIVLVAMWATVLAQCLITVAIDFFQWINPFNALQYLVTSKPTAIDGSNITQNGIFKPIMDMIRPFYSSLSDVTVSFAYLVLCIGILAAFTNARWGNVSPGSSLGKRLLGALLRYMRRVIVIVAGPLLIAVISTNMMSSMKGNVNGVTEDISMKSVWSTYVDFDGWVKHSRLGIPKTSDTSKSMDSLNSNGTNYLSNKFIYKINTDGAANSAARGASGLQHVKKDDGKTNISNLVSEAQKTSSFLMHDWVGCALTKSTDYDNEVLSYLRPYGKKENNKKWSTQEAKAGHQDNVNIGKDAKNKNWFAAGFHALQSAGDHIGAGIGGILDHIHGTSDDFSKNPYKFVKVKNWDDKDAYQNFLVDNGSLNFSNGYYTTDTPSAKHHAPELGNSKGSDGGLSTLGMYNYLNTVTDNSGLTYTQPYSFTAFGGGVNQHYSAGFTGRGMLAIGNFVKMISTMASVAVLLIFVSGMIMEGAITCIPRMLLYALNIVTGRWRGLLGVFKEMVGMFARVLVGELIIEIFVSFATDMDDTFAKMFSSLLNGNPITWSKAANSSLIMGNKFFPFMMSTFAIGLVRILSGALIAGICFLMIKNFFSILRWISNIFKEMSDKLGKFGFDGSKELGVNPPNVNNTSANHDNKTGDNSNNYGKNDDYNSLNPANNVANLDKNRQDSSLEDQNKDYPKGLKGEFGRASLAAMDKFDNSKFGKTAKKLGNGALAALGGSKLGHMMGLASRSQGRQAIPRLEKAWRKAAMAKANPKHVNNSKRAGMTDEEGANYDKKHQYAMQNLANDAIKKDAIKQADKLQQAKPYMDKFGEKGQAKDQDAAQDMDQDMNRMEEQGLGNQKLTEANENRQKMAQQASDNEFAKGKDGKTANQRKAEKNLSQKREAQQKAQQRLNEAKQDMQRFPEDAQVQKEFANAQKGMQKANKDVSKAQDQVKRARIMSNADLRNKAISGSHKQIGAHGEYLKKASKEQMQAARNRRFTAMTGKAAPMSANAKLTNNQRKQALADRAQAQRVLNDPKQSPEAKKVARKQLHNADVALQTGYQYGKYGNQEITGSYKNATADQLQQANANKDMDEFTSRTGYGVSENAAEADPATQAYANRLSQAQDVVSTGQVQDAQTGEYRDATDNEIDDAQREIAADPAHQTSLIRNSMAQTGETVLSEAQQVADQAVASAPDTATTGQLRQIRAQAMDNYMQKPEVAQRLASAGFETGTTSEIHQVQHASELNRAAVKSSLAPMRQSVESGTIHSDANSIVNAASNNYDKMNVAPELVTDDQYGKVNNKQWMQTASHLYKMYNSGDKAKLAKFKVVAAQNGLPTHIINDQNKLVDAMSKVQGERQNVIQNATAYARHNSTTPLADIEQYRQQTA